MNSSCVLPTCHTFYLLIKRSFIDVSDETSSMVSCTMVKKHMVYQSDILLPAAMKPW